MRPEFLLSLEDFLKIRSNQLPATEDHNNIMSRSVNQSSPTTSRSNNSERTHISGVSVAPNSSANSKSTVQKDFPKLSVRFILYFTFFYYF